MVPQLARWCHPSSQLPFFKLESLNLYSRVTQIPKSRILIFCLELVRWCHLGPRTYSSCQHRFKQVKIGSETLHALVRHAHSALTWTWHLGSMCQHHYYCSRPCPHFAPCSGHVFPNTKSGEGAYHCGPPTQPRPRAEASIWWPSGNLAERTHGHGGMRHGMEGAEVCWMKKMA